MLVSHLGVGARQVQFSCRLDNDETQSLNTELKAQLLEAQGKGVDKQATMTVAG